MNENANEIEAAPRQGRYVAGMKYLLTVGGLLVIIITLLAALWARERSWRLRAEASAVRWRHEYLQLRGALGKVVSDVPRAATVPARSDGAATTRPNRGDQGPDDGSTE